MMPLPSFYEPKQVRDVYVERVALVADAAADFKKKHNVLPASQDKLRIAAFGIDCQIGFSTPGASLFVPGAVEDTTRTIEWIYKNLDRITQVAFSLDTHRVFQIFHPAWWIDDEGKNPAPFTNISLADVREGKWKPIAHPAECLEYVKQLEKAGKYVLTVWPYHTLLGGVSHALVPALMEAAMFHALVRQAQTHFETKGTHAMTENYSVLAPEVRELGGKSVGTFNAAFFKMLMEFDRVYVFGQAKSHCVLSTLKDMQQNIAAVDASLMQKIFILEDATSPVPAPPITPLPAALDFPRVADQAFADLKAAGMNIVKTTDPIA
jgi:nicotinamidase-related amidase